MNLQLSNEKNQHIAKVEAVSERLPPVPSENQCISLESIPQMNIVRSVALLPIPNFAGYRHNCFSSQSAGNINDNSIFKFLRSGSKVNVNFYQNLGMMHQTGVNVRTRIMMRCL